MNYARKIYYGQKIEEDMEEKKKGGKSKKSKKTEDANRNLSRYYICIISSFHLMMSVVSFYFNFYENRRKYNALSFSI